MGELIPLFPLSTPLFPGIVLPLNIFEPRYRRLMQDLLAHPPASGRRFFGVTAIRQGWEVERIALTEVPQGVDMAQWALAWCLKDPVVTAVIPGCKNVEQVEKNARAAELVWWAAATAPGCCVLIGTRPRDQQRLRAQRRVDGGGAFQFVREGQN